MMRKVPVAIGVAALCLAALWLATLCIAVAFLLWVRTPGFMVEVPVAEWYAEHGSVNELRLILPKGSYIIYLALRSSDVTLESWEGAAQVKVSSVVTTAEDATYAHQDRILELDQEAIRRTKNAVQALSARDGENVPSPGRHVRDPDIALWQISDVWRAPEDLFSVDIEVRIPGELPPLGQWTLRVERFKDVI